MPNTHSTLSSLFSDIANAIRGKTGGTSQIKADNFPTEIAAIPSGGGDIDGHPIKTGMFTFAEDKTSNTKIVADFPAETRWTVMMFPLGSFSDFFNELGGGYTIIGSFSKRDNANLGVSLVNGQAENYNKEARLSGFLYKYYTGTDMYIMCGNNNKIKAGKTYYWIAIKDEEDD